MKILPWFLVFICIVAVALSTLCILRVQKTNKETLDYNNQLILALRNFQITVNDQAFALKIQAGHLQRLIDEKQNAIDIAIDMRTENYELKCNIELADETIDYLMEQIEEYRERLNEDYENLDLPFFDSVDETI